MTPEAFWHILFDEEAFKLEDWTTKHNSVDCIITPRRFQEALNRLNAHYDEGYREGYLDAVTHRGDDL